LISNPEGLGVVYDAAPGLALQIPPPGAGPVEPAAIIDSTSGCPNAVGCLTMHVELHASSWNASGQADGALFEGQILHPTLDLCVTSGFNWQRAAVQEELDCE
jgi:hypothetical protein